MKKIIKIAHLYYDLMNLYGESGNIKALKKFIERENAEVEIHFLTLDDKIDFTKYDMFYIGAGSEENELIVLSDLYKYKEQIKDAIESGKFFLATGNAMELFGKRIRFKTGKIIECLGIFDFNAVEAENRLVSDLVYECDELASSGGKYILGFKNCNSNIVNNDYKKPFKFQDNIHYKNFYGMMFVGPVLIRNPHFTDHLLEELFSSKGFKYTKFFDSIEYKAYEKHIENFVENGN